MTSSPDDNRFMATAIRLARHGLNSTSPNPRVGCVLVRNGELIAEGWHARAGEPHAEALALARAGEKAHRATAYVTLEPCSHHGRTGPCADALVAAGISRVVVGTEDPNPRVRGQGIARLRAAGIGVEVGVLASEARALNPGFFARMTRGRPWLCCKLAMSLDGRTAMSSGESQWITGESARQDVQRLRARSCAVMTGIGTVLTDDPRLDVRLGDAASARQPLRVVLDSQLRTPPGARLTATPGHALVVHADAHPGREQALVGAGCELLRLPDGQGRVALPALLDALAARECNEVLLEAGAALCGAFAAAGLIDEYRIYMAPVLLGSNARPLMELPFEHMAERLQLTITAVEAVGEDWRITAVPRA